MSPAAFYFVLLIHGMCVSTGALPIQNFIIGITSNVESLVDNTVLVITIQFSVPVLLPAHGTLSSVRAVFRDEESCLRYLANTNTASFDRRSASFHFHIGALTGLPNNLPQIAYLAYAGMGALQFATLDGAFVMSGGLVASAASTTTLHISPPAVHTEVQLTSAPFCTRGDAVMFFLEFTEAMTPGTLDVSRLTFQNCAFRDAHERPATGNSSIAIRCVVPMDAPEGLVTLSIARDAVLATLRSARGYVRFNIAATSLPLQII
jgi:hypothetical protein